MVDLAKRAEQKAEGARLRAFRRSKGWTQAQLATRLGLHVNTVARAERGEIGITRGTWRLVALLGKGARA